MRVTPPHPHLVRSIQVFLDGTQYAKGQYAVGKNPVKSYAKSNNSNFSCARFVCSFWGQKLAFTVRVPKFGHFWQFLSIFSIIYKQFCKIIKFGIKTGEPLIH